MTSSWRYGGSLTAGGGTRRRVSDLILRVMSQNNNVMETQSTYGMGCLGTVGAVLVILRAFGLIRWSWWVVTAPFWAPPAFLLVVFAAVWTVLTLKDWIKGKKEKKEGE